MRGLRAAGATVVALDEPDPVGQALIANEFDADVYLGFEAVGQRATA